MPHLLSLLGLEKVASIIPVTIADFFERKRIRKMRAPGFAAASTHDQRGSPSERMAVSVMFARILKLAFLAPDITTDILEASVVSVIAKAYRGAVRPLERVLARSGTH